VLQLIWVKLVVPETKGVSLEAMQHLLGIEAEPDAPSLAEKPAAARSSIHWQENRNNSPVAECHLFRLASFLNRLLRGASSSRVEGRERAARDRRGEGLGCCAP